MRGEDIIHRLEKAQFEIHPPLTTGTLSDILLNGGVHLTIDLLGRKAHFRSVRIRGVSILQTNNRGVISHEFIFDALINIFFFTNRLNERDDVAIAHGHFKNGNRGLGTFAHGRTSGIQYNPI